MDVDRMQERLAYMVENVLSASPSNWDDINKILSKLQDGLPTKPHLMKDDFYRQISRGTAFLTFDYGIDGVSIEISKYAQALEELFRPWGDASIHFIAGDFYPQAESVLKPEWPRFEIEGINGWSKWDDGRWFSALFYNEMPEDSPEADKLAVEIYRQAARIALELGTYLTENHISLLIPVNIASNPGNIALTIAFVLVTKVMGISVINSNHDYYWEGGKPASERMSGEPPGVRDHFFRNLNNRSFATVFTALYPWNGPRWLQININKLQSQELIDKFGFSETRVFELSTAVSDKFFEEYTFEDVKLARRRMGIILSNGDPILRSFPARTHLAGLAEWMGNQKPLLLGSREGLTLDPTSKDLIYLLQPTRIIARKRIERDLHLIGALLHHRPFLEEFEGNKERQLVLHITGPTPIEHQADLETVLNAYIDILESVPQAISDRLFLGFSVGNEYHPSFRTHNLDRMTIEDIYRMATAVVFPSESEGRGLPIVESSAIRVPLICSRYQPEEVFAEVVGETLTDNFQIRYTLFPEDDFSTSFLDEVTDLLLHRENFLDQLQHNQEVVRRRYSAEALKGSFQKFIEASRLAS